MKNNELIEVIDYLVENSACDLCGHCAYYKQPKNDEDYTPCNELEKHGNVACRNGMIEYFKKKEYWIEYEYTDKFTGLFEKGNKKIVSDYKTAEMTLYDILGDLEEQGHLNVAGAVQNEL